jgi:hypothetical protein
LTIAKPQSQVRLVLSDKSAHASKALETDFLDMKVAEKSFLQIASNKIELPL